MTLCWASEIFLAHLLAAVFDRKKRSASSGPKTTAVGIRRDGKAAIYFGQ